MATPAEPTPAQPRRARRPLGDEEPLYASFVGPNWARFYRARFERFASGGGPVAWNWAACLVPLWFSYRKLAFGRVLALLFVPATIRVANLFVDDPPELKILKGYLAVLLLTGVLQGAFGTWWLYRAARREVEALRGGGATAADERLVRRRPAAGFAPYAVHAAGVLVFGAIGFVVISFGVSMRHYWDRPGMVHQRSELRTLHAAQEVYRGRTGRYAVVLDSLGRPSAGDVTVTLREATDSGYVAQSAHRLSALRCAIFAGEVGAPPVDAIAGEPACYRVDRTGRWIPYRR